MGQNPFKHRKSGSKYITSKGPARTAHKMSKRSLRRYVKSMLDEWLLPDEIPVPPGSRKRNIMRLAERLGEN